MNKWYYQKFFARLTFQLPISRVHAVKILKSLATDPLSNDYSSFEVNFPVFFLQRKYFYMYVLVITTNITL